MNDDNMTRKWKESLNMHRHISWSVVVWAIVLWQAFSGTFFGTCHANGRHLFSKQQLELTTAQRPHTNVNKSYPPTSKCQMLFVLTLHIGQLSWRDALAVDIPLWVKEYAQAQHLSGLYSASPLFRSMRVFTAKCVHLFCCTCRVTRSKQKLLANR